MTDPAPSAALHHATTKTTNTAKDPHNRTKNCQHIFRLFFSKDSADMGSIRATVLAATVAVLATSGCYALAPIPSADTCSPIYPQVSVCTNACIFIGIELWGVDSVPRQFTYSHIDLTSRLPHPRSARAQQPPRYRASRFPTYMPKLLRCECMRALQGV